MGKLSVSPFVSCFSLRYSPTNLVVPNVEQLNSMVIYVEVANGWVGLELGGPIRVTGWIWTGGIWVKIEWVGYGWLGYSSSIPMKALLTQINCLDVFD